MYEVNIDWIIVNRIVLVEPVGDFESSIAVHAIRQVKHLLDQAHHPLHLVMHMSRVRTAVKDPRDMGHAIKGLRFHRNMAGLYFIASNYSSCIGGILLARFLGKPFKIVHSFEQALKTLAKVDPTLDLVHADEMKASTMKWMEMNSIR
ncbi:MAG: hypothetical protein R3E39_31935 [Anaerolineae bacterium]